MEPPPEPARCSTRALAKSNWQSGGEFDKEARTWGLRRPLFVDLGREEQVPATNGSVAWYYCTYGDAVPSRGCVARYREAIRILESLAQSVVNVSTER